MPAPVQKIREIVFQMLYSFDMGKATDELMLDLLSKELTVPKKTVRNAQLKVHKIRSHLAEIDKLIAATSFSYAFDRIQSVERNILRLGTYEILFDSTIPPKVALAEAFRLAKKFGTKESGLFVNAILDAIYKSKLGDTTDTTQLQQVSIDLKESEKAAHNASLITNLKDQNKLLP